MVEIRRGLERASGFVLLAVLLIPLGSTGQELPLVRTVDLQPLAAQALRLIETMDYLGSPLDPADQALLRQAAEARNPAEDIVSIQKVLDNYTLIDVRIDPESRVKVDQGLAPAELVEQGWRTFLVKVRNEANVTAELRVESPNAGPVYTRSTGNPSPDQILKPADQMNRWLDLFLYKLRPMRPRLSGLELEYTILQVYSRDRGKREARISFNVGQGTQDIGFRNDLNLVFNSRPSIDVTLRIFDEKGEPTTASFIFRDPQGHVYPSQAKRLAPDFPFHPQVYRSDGESLKLPPGTYSVEYTRGPEYHLKHDTVEIAAGRPQALTFRLDRWIRPSDWGWYSGDHHIHAAGCAHYEDPTQGVFPQDMIRHIKGEALNVGNVLTWGPCFYFQKQFFEAKVSSLSTRENLMRYDVEVSGFPSSHSGHLTLLNLNQQEYPGTRRIEDWPTWDLPILKWARSQGAVVGFAHSGWGLEVETEKLPHYEMPPFDGIGANEYIVDVTHDMVDFISTVDTPAHWELNIWYHTLNTGFRTRISGETDFPCIYGERVGLGRVYVKLDEALSYDGWVEGLRRGRSYVSDGKSHLMDFRLNGLFVGTGESEVRLAAPAKVRVTARVAALLAEQPNEATEALRNLPLDRKPYWDIERARLSQSRQVAVELVVNGYAVAKKSIVADGSIQDVSFEVPIERSSWVAMRIFPSSHTNPIFVVMDGKPIRASRRSAQWCLDAVDQCWNRKRTRIAPSEIAEAQNAYEHARRVYRRILAESQLD